jgi:putative restriction endonuclease
LVGLEGLMPPRHFGHVPGIPIGTTFARRAELSDARVHRPLMQGISGRRADGADSIVVSGGYVDDEDYGDVIIYTGHGGNDPATKRQIADQSTTASGNAGLIVSRERGLPVRVTRGSAGEFAGAPANGFRYDGLYLVVDHWVERGRDGYLIVRYRLEAIPGDSADFGTLDGSPTALANRSRRASTGAAHHRPTANP